MYKEGNRFHKIWQPFMSYCFKCLWYFYKKGLCRVSPAFSYLLLFLIGCVNPEASACLCKYVSMRCSAPLGLI